MSNDKSWWEALAELLKQILKEFKNTFVLSSFTGVTPISEIVQPGGGIVIGSDYLLVLT